MTYQGVIFFDYDGTLADEKLGIYLPTQATRRAVEAASGKGYMTVLSTGRAKCYVPDTGISFDGYVTTNGAYAEAERKPVYEKYIEENDLARLMEAMDAMGLAYSLENQHICYASDLTDPDFLHMLDNFGIPLSVFRPLSEMPARKASKLLMAYREEAQFEKLSAAFSGVFSLYKHRKNKSVDINCTGITKATGAAEIIRKFGIPRESVYVFGDGSNDYDIMKLAGHGVAMRDHAACLDQVCEMVTGGVEEEGIAVALQKYGII